MGLKKATIISLLDFENEELLRIKPTRSKAEYCWTSTPSILWYTIHKFCLPSCTYVDADTYFYRSPKIIFDEIGENSVAITLHTFRNKPSIQMVGKFCVQFNYFKSDETGLAALRWWKDSCIDWCFARYEDGKYADQKYIDDLPFRFQKVHVIQNRGAGLAQWNLEDYFIKDVDNLIFTEKETKRDFELIFYHFHYTRFKCEDGVVNIKRFQVPIHKMTLDRIYIPYIIELASIEAQYLNNEEDFKVKKVHLQRYGILNHMTRKLKDEAKKSKIGLLMHNYFSRKRIIKPYNGSKSDH